MRFEWYVQEAKVHDKERVKELLPLLEDELLRLVVQNDFSESADYQAVQAVCKAAMVMKAWKWNGRPNFKLVCNSMVSPW